MSSLSADDATISIIIPHYGDPHLALTLIEDLRGQVADGDEIIVVDDCSPRPFPETPGVEVVRRANNGGFGAAVNSGVSLARGEWLLIANSDLRIPPGTLPTFRSAARSFMPGVVGPRSVDADGHPEYSARRFPKARHLALALALPMQPFIGSAWHLKLSGRVIDEGIVPRPVDWLQGSCLLLPTRLYRAAGGFDERYVMYSEEVDLQRRLASEGFKTWLLPHIVVTHAGGASSTDINIGERMMKSRLLYAEKFGEIRTMRRALKLVAIVNLICRLVMRISGRPTGPRQGWRREWHHAVMPVETEPRSNHR